MILDSYDHPDAQALLSAGEARRRDGVTCREQVSEAIAGGGFLAAAAVLAVAAPWPRQLSLASLAVMLVAYLAATRVRFAVSDGYTFPTQLVFVPMLFVLPVPVVPLVVAGAALLARGLDCLGGRDSPRRLVLCFGDMWYALGPALVLVLTGSGEFAWSRWPAYLAALGAQVAFDAGSAVARGWFAERIPPRLQLSLLTWVWLVDAQLSAIALPLAAAAVSTPALVLLCLPVDAMFALFARERRQRIEQSADLSLAYRGTALLLGDVVEADDAYTGGHSRDVLELSLAVADALELDALQRRHVEFGALLHDVGKVRVPKEIVNKPGPLDADEWAVMRNHTIEGEAMLARVGGVLAEVGRIVRASHEHFDGRGYPDGLAREAIPIEARIVTACDAYSAMTTDRPYRRARSKAAALAELERCAGTQFDPRVVAAVLLVVEALAAPDEPAVAELAA